MTLAADVDLPLRDFAPDNRHLTAVAHCNAPLFKINSTAIQWDNFALAFYRAAVPRALFRCYVRDPDDSFPGPAILDRHSLRIVAYEVYQRAIPK
jgi:hypothetical protein